MVIISVPRFPKLARPVFSGLYETHGYGWTSYQGDFPTESRMMDTRVNERAICVNAFGSDIANEDVFCATPILSQPWGICNGDQGGPVTTRLFNEEVIGISSFWFGNCEPHAIFGVVMISNYEEFLSQPPFL